MSGKLEGKIAVVTGGSAGIGLGAARRFAQEGARVFITGRDQAKLDRAVADLRADLAGMGVPGATIDGLQGDTSNLADIDRIYAAVKDQAGRIDVLLANAGFYEFGTFGQITEAHYDKTFDTNVRGVLFTVQKALPLLPKGASVILTGSVASIKGFESFGVYNATKAALRSFARTWIIDLKGRDIRINVLSPGHIETPGLSGLFDDAQKAGAIANVPLGRIGTADDMGKVAVFLASDDSSYVTGVELFADGGVAQY